MVLFTNPKIIYEIQLKKLIIRNFRKKKYYDKTNSKFGLKTNHLFTGREVRFRRNCSWGTGTKDRVGRWITFFFFFSRERRQEANEARVVASYAPPSVFFMSIIKRQIKTLSSSTAMSVFNFSVFASKKPHPDVQLVLRFLSTVFSTFAHLPL